MPLVRVPVGGSDAESFDTFDVAEMTYNQQAPRNWLSRQASGGGKPATAATTPRLAKPCKNTFIPTSAETEYLTSIDSSSGRRSEGTDRIDAVMPIYDVMENLDEMQHDPRNPFNRSPNTRRCWGVDYIPEEDEISLSTMGDSSVTPSLIMQHQSTIYQNSRTNLQLNQPQNRSHRHHQKQRPSTSSQSDVDDFSVASYQSESTRKGRTSDNRTIPQLEAQVAKLNFELATTKASLDELKLENRRLNVDKSALSNDVKVLKEENEHLHLKIERLEKEKILRNMEGTKGVARASIDRAPHSGWGGATNSGNSLAGDNCARATSSNREYMHVTTRSLEVPFRNPDSEYSSRPKRSSITSFASSDELSDGGKLNDSAHSIAFGDTDNKSDSSEDVGKDKQEKIGKMNLLKMVGVGKRPPVGEMTNQIQDASISSQSNRKRVHTKEQAFISIGSLPSSRLDSHNNHAEDNENKSNPQGEDLSDEDPFATWSAPGDPRRIEPEQNWLQRGLGGFGRDRKSSRQQQLDDVVEDPFDSCNGGIHDSEITEDGKYTSFADNLSETSGSSETTRGRKNFGLFIGFGRRR